MSEKKFTLWNRLAAAAVFVVAAITYLLTIEPTASFWDCGEFIASSYKLEVGHPPGNPVFQLFARFFTMFFDNMHAAVAVNAMNAICSALTIFFLYLTIVFFAKRVVNPSDDGTYTVGKQSRSSVPELSVLLHTASATRSGSLLLKVKCTPCPLSLRLSFSGL